jgi:hypothetical protein
VAASHQSHLVWGRNCGAQQEKYSIKNLHVTAITRLRLALGYQTRIDPLLTYVTAALEGVNAAFAKVWSWNP